jgi:beta-glucuronidase
MLERSDLAENALACLHDESYATPFDTRDLNADRWLFTGGRAAHSLDGDWRFCVDPSDTGLRQRWYCVQRMAAEDRPEPWDWDPHEGETITVPSCWQNLRERWFHYEGSAWYARDIDPADMPQGERQFLRVGAAAYDCKVFLNGEFLGSHRGASTPFIVEITGRLKPGPNLLLMCVNNDRRPDRVPMQNTDWFNYGGLHRSVEIFATPAAVIRDLFVRLVPNGRFDAIAVSAELEGDAGEATLRIPGLGIEQRLTPGPNGWAHAEIAARPDLWAPGAPVLYDVTLDWGADHVADRVGFREIRRQGTDIVLNGKPIFLRGVSVHEDDEHLGRLCTPTELTRRFDHATELGCNFLRLAHYPHHEAAARMADERGFLLWEEVPVYWAIAFDNPATLADARNQLSELIRRDRNRASVVIWSVGNENPDTDPRLAFMGALVDCCRSLDPTRLVSAACLINHAKLKIEDRLAGKLDIIGINEYYGWYDENFEDLARIGANSNPDRPVVISETGADAAIGPGAPARGLFSESYQAEVYRRQIETLDALPYVKGVSPWILYDFRAERRQNVFQRGWNRKGLIAQDKTTRKTAFGLLAAWYARIAARES